MDKILISIVIPIYNAEKFISRSVDSALDQIGKNYEVILVDDGSTDGSGKICDDYAAKDPRVQVVHKVNGGLSSARNAGTPVAKGEYIVYLDADDFLDPDTCSELTKVIEANHPDCIDFGWKYLSSSGEVTSNLHKLPKNALLGEDVLKDTILPPVLNLRKDDDHFIFDFACNKVYRRDIMTSKGIAFDEGRRIWEDRPFVAHYLKHCRNFYSMDRCFYNYVDVSGSLSRKYSMEFFRVILANYHHYKQLFGDEYDFDTQYVNDHWCHSIENMIFRSLEQSEDREAIRKNILETLRNEQVIHWFASRTPEDNFEKEMSALVAAGDAEKALHGYEKNLILKNKRARVGAVGNNMKRLIRKVIGR